MNLLLTGLLALGLTLALTLLFARLAEGQLPLAPRRPAAVWGSADGLAATLGLALSAAALALLPWPLHPAGAHVLVGHPIMLWCAIEGAFLAPLLPGLLAPSPLAVRAAMREAQITAAGRAVVWLAIGITLFGGIGWAPVDAPARILAALAALLALPVSVGGGPFAPERSLSPAGAEEGLDEDTSRLLRLARTARGAVVLATLVVASLPQHSSGADTAAPPALAILAAQLIVFVAAAVALGRYAEGQPRSTLPAALRWCWWRALPLALVGLVYIAVT